MKSTFFASVLLLGTMGSPVMAQNGDVSPATGGPVMLSVAQMDTVRGGQLVEVEVRDNQVAVAVPLNVTAAANVCAVIAACAAGASSEQRDSGNIDQRR